MVKSKLPPQSGSSLETVEPHPQKGAIKFFFFCILSDEAKLFATNFSKNSDFDDSVEII